MKIKTVLLFATFVLLSSHLTAQAADTLIKGPLNKKDIETVVRRAIGKRIVFLGEPDHWIQEKGQYQLQLIEALLKEGFNTVVNERSYQDSKPIFEFIKTGDLSFFDSCGECGYFDPSWPKRETTGILAVESQFAFEYFTRLQASDRFFFSQLSKLYQSTPFHYQGYDTDKVADILFDKLESYKQPFSKAGSEICLNHFEKVKRSATGNYKEEFLSLDLSKASLEPCLDDVELDQKVESGYRELFRQSYESLKFMAFAYSNPSPEELNLAYAIREKTMFRHLDGLLRDLSNRIIVLGHNAHLPLDHREYVRLMPDQGKEREEPSWQTLGSYLNRKYPDDVLAVWMLYESGTHANIGCETKFPCEATADPRSIETLLSSKGYDDGIYTSEFLNQLSGPKSIWMENGIVPVSGHLEKVVDLVYFQKTVSAL
jgi:hypothetical protein